MATTQKRSTRARKAAPRNSKRAAPPVARRKPSKASVVERKPGQKASTKAPRLSLVDAWAEEIRREVAKPAFQRDPEFLKRLLPLMELWGRYFDAEVRGFENVPDRGPVLLVGNHSGGMITPDTSAVMAAWYRERGLDRPLVGLAFDSAFGIPGFRNLMRKIGQVPANWDNVGKALEEGNAVLVYPGGVHEVYRPWKDRDKVDFGGHKGFIRVALQKQVPVVPIVGHGGHHTLMVLTRGEKLAKFFRMERLRMRQYPILLQIPWGVSTPAFPGIPIPAKVTVEILPPIDWRKLGPKAADDPKIIDRCYDEITGKMQLAMDRLVAENPHPIRARLKKLIRRA